MSLILWSLCGALAGAALTIAAYNLMWLSGKLYELLDWWDHRNDHKD